MSLSRAEIDAISQDYIDKVITSQVYEDSPLVAKLKTKGNVTIDGGTNIQFPIRYQELNRAEFISPRQQITYSQKETRTSGKLDWKYLFGQAMLQLDERVKNSGKQQIINLITDKSEEMIDDIKDKFDEALYSTSQASDAFSSLDTIVDSATDYADIAVADAAEWAANEDSSTDRVKLYNSSGSLSYMMNASTFGKNKPDLIITTRDLFSKIESMIEPQKRYTGDLGKIGFSTVMFMGAEVVGDYACPTGYLYGLTTKFWEFITHKDWNMKKSKWMDMPQAGFPYALVKTCLWAGNLKCTCRKVNFKMSALDYTL